MQVHGIGVNTRVSLGSNAILYSGLQKKAAQYQHALSQGSLCVELNP